MIESQGLPWEQDQNSSDPRLENQFRLTVKLPQDFGENRSTHEPILETLKNCVMGRHLEYNSAKLGSNKVEN